MTTQETTISFSMAAATLPGFRFCPNERELIHYLYGKNNGSLSPVDQQVPINYWDLYGNDEPWEIWKNFGGDNLTHLDALFFFTSLKKVANGGCNISRKVGTSAGKWHGETSGISSVLRFGGIRAYKKRFNYWNPSRLDQDRRWNMIEYSLCDGESKYVLCELKRNRKESKKRKNQSEHDEAVDDQPDERSMVQQELPMTWQETQMAVNVIQYAMAAPAALLPFPDNDDQGSAAPVQKDSWPSNQDLPLYDDSCLSCINIDNNMDGEQELQIKNLEQN